MVGAVFGNDNAKLTIQNSYNSGNITGQKGSATLCGYSRKNYTFTNCYNSGTIAGNNSGEKFYNPVSGGTTSVVNCYDVNGTQTGVTKVTADDVVYGKLCNWLNSNGATVFTQDISSDAHPYPGEEGLIPQENVQHITDYASLSEFTTKVNGGFDFTGYTILLDNDLDLSGHTFTPIGNSTNPFRGTFNGMGHAIKNMTLTTAKSETGFFGCVSGDSTVVKNLVIDSSCSVTSTSGYGIAGLIGCVSSTKGTKCELYIENCGNEANVTGVENVAGLLGGVYNNDNTVVNVTNCYNTGNISGNSGKISASIVGYARLHTNISNTYNSGTVGGTENYKTFAYTGLSGFDGTISNCYTTVTWDQTPNVTIISEDLVSSGDLCNSLNATSIAFSQKLGTEFYPVNGTDGVTGSLTLNISTADELVAFANNVNSGVSFAKFTVKLSNDIDLSEKAFPMIGSSATTPFRGTFDGQGHRIKNMSLSFAQNYVGFFGSVAGTSTIKNVIIDSSCSVTSTSGSGIAGLIGGTVPYNDVASNVTVWNCGNEANVTGIENAAGLVGGVYGVDANVLNVLNCYNTGTVKGNSGNKSASIVGYARVHTNITNTYNSGTVGGTLDYLTFAYTGASGFSGTLTNCYTTVSGDKTSNVTFVEANQVKSGELCGLLNKDSVVFAQDVTGDVYPIPGTEGLTGLEVTSIGDATSLLAFANDVNSDAGEKLYNVVLTNDIDLNGSAITIGNASNPFKGTFDGQGHCIKNMTITGATAPAGFFGCLAGTNTVIKNLLIDSSCSVTSTSGAGVAGLAGRIQSTSGTICNVTIEKCGNDANVTGKSDVAGLVGGVFDNESTVLTISNCYNTGAITGDADSKSASIVGDALKHTNITNTYNSGTVGGTLDYYTFAYVKASDGTLSNCYTINTIDKTKNVTKITTDQVSSGDLCTTLNNNVANTFAQVFGTDFHPVIGEGGTSGSKVINISTADSLVIIANLVNKGVSLNGYTINLLADISLSGTSFPMIGNSADNPFMGTFNGNGHRIKDMSLSFAQNYVGLFGTVAGTSTIENVIIDKSCSVTSTSGSGVAGLIGGTVPFNSTASNVTVWNCGNEANVTGIENAAGLVGGVYGNDANVLNVLNCYNTGTVKGNSGNKSASIVGYARVHTNITNTYNSGTVGGTTDYLTFAYTGASGFSGKMTNCYTTISGDKTPNVTHIESGLVSSGELCTALNKDSVVFTQNVTTDKYPIPGKEGSYTLIEKKISTATELLEFATLVNAGAGASSYAVTLENDIDLTGKTLSPIGNSSNPFKGTFDGQGHRIKNMTMTSSTGGTGFFGCINGSNTIIKNLIIDSSCSVTSTATASSSSYSGVAGLVGSVTSTSGTICNVTIENCGNEAAVSGYNNVSGILGGVYDNDNTTITIKGTFNTGNITGKTTSATLCGWARKNYTFINCYNSGSISGVDGTNTLYNYSSGNHKVENCYDINEGNLKGENVIIDDQVSSGALCNLLNTDSLVFAQNLGTQFHPIPGKAGLTGEAVINISTADELVAMANAVNSGVSLSSYTVNLLNDISLKDVAFPMIGNSDTTPFKGTFNGNGHRITNMSLNFAGCHVGFFGNVAGSSTIKNVIIDKSCSVTSTSGSGVAGLIGGTKPSNGLASNVTVWNCGNEAAVTGVENVAGLVGGVYDKDANVLNVINCYNTGAITGGAESKSASIVGYARLHTNIRNTYNSGTVGGTLDWLTFAYTGVDGFNGKLINCYTTVSGDETPKVTVISADDVRYSKLCTWLDKDSTVFTQDIRTDSYPYPGTAGLVRLDDMETISSLAELNTLAEYTNGGFDFSDYTISLANDIDMSGTDNFTPIGTTSNPFMGTFDGQGYRIKNMTINLPQGAIGLFGAVAGKATVIKNVVIDKSCSVKSTATGSSSSYSGVAGLIGGVWSANGTQCNVSIMNCGNEANVQGYNNVAGLLGGVYQNDATVVNVNNCYNTGTIGGSSDSRTASIVGYARKHTNIRNTWNSGTVGGTYEYYTFAYMGADGFDGTIENCYTIGGKNATENSKSGVVTLDQNKYTLGALCQTLNTNIGSNTAWTKWTQDIATETIPSFGDADLHYTRTMTNQWGTVCLPFAASSGNGYDFYMLQSASSDALTLSKVDNLDAGVPAIILRSEAATGVDIPVSSTDADVVTTPGEGSSANGLTLTGTFTSEKISGKDGYFISNNAFWNLDDYSNVYCDPFRAYLAGSLSSGAKMLTINIDDETTAVDALSAITEGEAEYYDLSGHKLNSLQKGINIVKFSNGVTKKVIIK